MARNPITANEINAPIHERLEGIKQSYIEGKLSTDEARVLDQHWRRQLVLPNEAKRRAASDGYRRRMGDITLIAILAAILVIAIGVAILAIITK